MENIVRTAAGSLLQTSHLLNIPLQIQPYTTLNEKFNIFPDVAIADTDTPSVSYFTIGNGGHKMAIGVNNIPRPEPIQHKARDAALYNHIPFVLRLPSNDLTPVERANYRLRRQETHNGTQYIAYYAKVINKSTTVPRTELRTVDNGITTSVLFVPTIDDLNPTPPVITTGGSLTTTGDYIAITAKLPLVLTVADINELLNVAQIIYGDQDYAMISEIGLCSGIDKSVTGNFNGSNASYVDAIGVQIVTFISSFYSLKFTNDNISLILDVGTVEPLLNIS